MRKQATRQPYSGQFFLALLWLGMLVPMGCAHRAGGDLAFRRFWGFDQQQADPNLAERETSPPSNGFFSKFQLRKSSSSGEAHDPFLAQIASAENTPNGDSASGEVETPAIGWDSSAQAEIAQTTGNPFRLMQHRTPVSDISSEQAEPNSGADGTSGEEPPGPSQLDRLKIALSRDAKTQLPMKSKLEDVEHARQQVESMMKTARRQIQFGEYASALRWAMAAEQLAGRSELFFGPEEDPPADLVRRLQDRLKIVPEPIAPTVQALTEEPTLPMPAESEAPPASTPGTELSESQMPVVTPGFGGLIPPLPQPHSTGPHSTGAMQQAVIAPETVTPPANLIPPANRPTVITPSQMHARSLKVDARRVSANHGAAVSVEGQLNPPVESPLPQLPMAPPVMEGNMELPPFEVSMTEPVPPLPAPSPLPPPSAMEPPQSLPSQFFHAESNAPASKPVRNVNWNDTDSLELPKEKPWWIFPLIGVAGIVLLGLLFLRRRGG